MKKTLIKLFRNKHVKEVENEVNKFITQDAVEVIEVTETMNEKEILIKVFYLLDTEEAGVYA